MTPDPSVPPVRIETLKKYAKAIFDPIRRGESVTCVWVPMAGRRLISKFIINNPSLFTDAIGDPSRCLLVYLEPLELIEESLAGYIRLMGKSILETCQQNNHIKDLKKLVTEGRLACFSDESATSTRLLSELKSLIQRIVDLEVEVVLFLGKFDELSFANALFCNNLKSLWASFRPCLHYVFLTRTDITRFETAREYAGLVSVVMQNIVYVPLLEDKGVEYILDREKERLKTNFSQKEKKVIKKVCGSHPYLLVIGCRTLVNREDRAELSGKQLTDVLLGYHQLCSPAREIWTLRTREEKELLKRIVDDGVRDLPGEGLVLEKLGLVKKEDKSGKYVLFSQLFEKAVLGATKTKPSLKGVPKTLTLDPETGAILLGNRTIEEEFTRQEYDVLSFLLREPNKLRTRDEIGNVLWGEDSYDKFSNWAIDQLMSQLRKKLERLGVGKKKLATIRGRGYKFLRSGD